MAGLCAAPVSASTSGAVGRVRSCHRVGRRPYLGDLLQEVVLERARPPCQFVTANAALMTGRTGGARCYGSRFVAVPVFGHRCRSRVTRRCRIVPPGARANVGVRVGDGTIATGGTAATIARGRSGRRRNVVSTLTDGSVIAIIATASGTSRSASSLTTVRSCHLPSAVATSSPVCSTSVHANLGKAAAHSLSGSLSLLYPSSVLVCRENSSQLFTIALTTTHYRCNGESLVIQHIINLPSSLV